MRTTPEVDSPAEREAIDPTARRRMPTQQRARVTYDKLCTAALQLLAEGGLGALNTNAVAAKAGVSVTAVYFYFPDKYAILHELFLRQEERRTEMLVPYIRRFSTDEDWRKPLRQSIAEAARVRVDEADTRALRSALAAVPALAELDAESTRVTAERLADALRARKPAVSKADANRAGMLLISVLTTALDACVRDGSLDRRLLAETTRMAELYVADLLER